MREYVVVTGMVLRAAPSGEGDRRLVMLTRERGRITVFARGARRPGSPFLAACRPFSFGEFRLYEGRDAYNLQGAEITAYFEELSTDMEGACYGSYFLEVAEYYSRENLDGTELLMLVYQSLRALLKESIPNELVRRVFELKAMVLNGEYTELPPFSVSDSACRDHRNTYRVHHLRHKRHSSDLADMSSGLCSFCHHRVGAAALHTLCKG